MICPVTGNRDFDDLDCRDCEWYMQCFKMWQDGNIWSKKEEPLGDNFPNFIQNEICVKDNMVICNLGYACDACPYNNSINKKKRKMINKITKEELDKFKIELGEIIFYSDWEAKINDKSN
jgi:hypothetical protein